MQLVAVWVEDVADPFAPGHLFPATTPAAGTVGSGEMARLCVLSRSETYCGSPSSGNWWTVSATNVVR